MLIKPTDAATSSSSTSSVSLRPVDVAKLTSRPPPAGENDSVSLSNSVQNLASALREALSKQEAARSAELLTPRDRLVLVRALELANAENLDAKEVHRLIVDLTEYRAAERDRLPISVTSASLRQQETAATRAQDGRLALPTFSARDESIARSLLTSLALRDTAVDHGFVRTLVDPDRQPTHTVDFAFLRRLVLALSPSYASGALDANVSLERRLARNALADAIATLELEQSKLPEPSPELVTRGRALLRDGLTRLAQEALARNDKPLLLELRADDRALLSVLYTAAKAKRLDPALVDDVTRSLIALRQAERDEAVAIQRVLVPSVRPASPGASQPPARATLFPRPLTIRPDVADSAEQALAVRSQSQAPSALDEALDPAASARAFGSASQLAAKAAGGYRSMAPPPLAGPTNAAPSPDLGPEPLASLLASERMSNLGVGAQQLTLATALARPLDVTQALGLSMMVSRARAQLRRMQSTRLRHEHDAVRPVTAARAAGPEMEADDPLLDRSRRATRRRVRWQLVMMRLKRRRQGQE